jgi:hypothetical protein
MEKDGFEFDHGLSVKMAAAGQQGGEGGAATGIAGNDEAGFWHVLHSQKDKSKINKIKTNN